MILLLTILMAIFFLFLFLSGVFELLQAVWELRKGDNRNAYIGKRMLGMALIVISFVAPYLFLFMSSITTAQQIQHYTVPWYFVISLGSGKRKPVERMSVSELPFLQSSGGWNRYRKWVLCFHPDPPKGIDWVGADHPSEAQRDSLWPDRGRMEWHPFITAKGKNSSWWAIFTRWI